MKQACLRLAETSIQKTVPGRSKDVQFVPASGRLCRFAICDRRQSESRAIGPDEAGRVVESAFGSDFADGFSSSLHEHPGVLQAMIQNPVSGSLAGLLFECAFKGGKTSIGKPGVVLKRERSQHVLGNDVLGIRALLVEYFAKEGLQIICDGRVQQEQ